MPSRPRRTAAALPAPLTPFVGRAAERAALGAALAGHRLVTAVGPGGIGKTRLALAVAAEQAGRFTGGVWYADLVPVTDGAMVAAALAAALGLGEQPGRSAEETVLAWFGDREALLVLDNCEHVVEGVVVLAERVLAACPGVTVLATSRARLLVPHERVFLVLAERGITLARRAWRPGGRECPGHRGPLGRARGRPPGTGCSPRRTGSMRRVAGTSGRARSSWPAAQSGHAARMSWRRWAPPGWHRPDDGGGAQNRVGGPAGTGSGSGSTSGTLARTSSWKRRASSSAATLSGVWMNTVGERPSRSQPATVPSQGCHPATVRAASSRPM